MLLSVIGRFDFFSRPVEPIRHNLPLTVMTQAQQHTISSHDDVDQRDDRVDRRLLEDIARHRDKQAMEAFYLRYQDRLVPFLMRFTRDQALLQETYNDVMHKVWRKAHQYKGQSKVSSWVFSIGYRSCLRAIKGADRYPSVEDMVLEQAAEDPNLEMQDAIQKALQVLSPNHRLVIELTYFQGMATKEIAEVINRPANTVKTRLHHARNQLRQHLEEHYAL